jgi:para-nitrobenzyl esterase
MKRVLFICMVAWAAMACNAQSNTPGLVKVTGGMVQGVVENDMMIFKGIPFAAPPVGELRWKAPQPVIPWEGVRNADKFGPSPMSSMGMQRDASEDCLYLNVWTPAKSAKEKLPVMVWIYGGGFSMGTSSTFNGAPLAREGVVLVTINYRVGKLGFFAHPDLSAENPEHVSGNYGILDQIAALKWVKNNIAQFGGDPAKVTIFGESAGGISVSMLCASPLAKGLFRGAISQSGSSFGPIRPKSYPGENMKSLAQSEKEGAAYAESVGAKTIKDLRAMSPAELSRQTVVTGGAWPIVDGYVIPDDQYKLYEAGRYNDVALLIGYNSDEGDSFGFTEDPTQHVASVRERYEDYADQLLAVYPLVDGKVVKATRDLGRDSAFGWGTWVWGRLQNKTGKQPVYMYYFDQDPMYRQGDRRYGHRSPHGQDVDFVFQSLRPNTSNPTDQALAKYMLKYWTNFAKYCDPNGKQRDPALPTWPLFKNDRSQVMVLTGEGPHPAPVASEDAMWVLDKYFAWRRSQE